LTDSNRAIHEGDVDLGSILVKAFNRSHLLVDRSAGKPSIDMHSKPYEPATSSDRSAPRTQAGRQADGGPEEIGASASRTESGTPSPAPQPEQNRAVQDSDSVGDAPEDRKADVPAFDGPATIATGTDVDPEAEHAPDDAACDIERLRDSVDDDHDFGRELRFYAQHDRPSDRYGSGAGRT